MQKHAAIYTHFKQRDLYSTLLFGYEAPQGCSEDANHCMVSAAIENLQKSCHWQKCSFPLAQPVCDCVHIAGLAYASYIFKPWSWMPQHGVTQIYQNNTLLQMDGTQRFFSHLLCPNFHAFGVSLTKIVILLAGFRLLSIFFISTIWKYEKTDNGI